MNNIQHHASVATFWAYIQNWVSRGLTLVVFIVLARLLSPTDFGVFAIAIVLLTLAEIFAEQGLSHAIVQRAELDDAHRNTAFWVTLLLGGILGLLTLAVSHPLAAYFNHPEIAPIMNALSPVFVLMALASVPAALLRRELNYKILAQRAIWANIVAGITAIGLALSGAGVWAFVGQLLVYHGVSVIILWKNEAWRPRRMVSWHHFTDLFLFSSKVIAGKLLDFIETRVFDLIVGYSLGVRDLGQYSLANRAQQALSQLVVVPVWDSHGSVLARLSTQLHERKKAFLRAVTFVSLVPVPIFLMVAAAAPVLIPTVFGRQWVSSISAFQILAVLGAIRSLVFLNGVFLQAAGFAGRSVAITLIRVGVGLLALFFLLPYGITGVAGALLVGQLVAVPLSFSLTKRFLDVDFQETSKMMLKPLLASLFAVVSTVVVIDGLKDTMPSWAVLLCGLLAGSIIYIGLIVLLMPRTLIQAAARLPLILRRYVVTPIEFILMLREKIWLWNYKSIFHIFCKWYPQSRLDGKFTDQASGILLIPPDTSSIGGSLGDQALLGGVVAALRHRGYKKVMVLCKRGATPPPPMGISVSLVHAWNDLRTISLLIKAIRASKAVILIGADTLDGFYTPFYSEVQMLMAEFGYSQGCDSRIVSFSFNAKPHPRAITALRGLPDAVQLFVRDGVSADRVEFSTGHSTRRVADVGFLICPDLGCSLDNLIAIWAKDHKRNERTVVAWNISYHCLLQLDKEGVRKIIEASEYVIRQLISDCNAALVLVPHDFRKNGGDVQLLKNLKEKLEDLGDDRVLLLSNPYTASEIKAACRHFDFLFTGRMHLMIAALGMGVPSVAIASQGKFEGLFDHFGLNQSYIITAGLACNKADLERFILAHFYERDKIKEAILVRLPDVLKLSDRNFSGLEGLPNEKA